MTRFRMWGRGEHLAGCYTVARWCLAGVVVLLVLNIIPVALFVIGDGPADAWRLFWGPWLHVIRIAILLGVLAGAAWTVQELSVHAERAEVYKRMIERRLVARKHDTAGDSRPRFGEIGVRW